MKRPILILVAALLAVFVFGTTNAASADAHYLQKNRALGKTADFAGDVCVQFSGCVDWGRTCDTGGNRSFHKVPCIAYIYFAEAPTTCEWNVLWRVSPYSWRIRQSYTSEPRCY